MSGICRRAAGRSAPARLYLLSEEHGAGRQLVRCASPPLLAARARELGRVRAARHGRGARQRLVRGSHPRRCRGGSRRGGLHDGGRASAAGSSRRSSLVASISPGVALVRSVDLEQSEISEPHGQRQAITGFHLLRPAHRGGAPIPPPHRGDLRDQHAVGAAHPAHAGSPSDSRRQRDRLSCAPGLPRRVVPSAVSDSNDGILVLSAFMFLVSPS